MKRKKKKKTMHDYETIPPEIAAKMISDGECYVVDVRTPPEYRDVGHVPGTALVVWPRTGAEEDLRHFVAEIAANFEPTATLLLLCRSGVRSHYAARLAAHAGFSNAHNVLEGFEGEYDAGNGWRNAGLPWEQG